LTSVWVTTSRGSFMTDDKGTPVATLTVDVWLVTDGGDVKYLTFDDESAESFAETFNRHCDQPVRIERRSARII